MDESLDLVNRMMIAAKVDVQKALSGLAVTAEGVADPYRAEVIAVFTDFTEAPLKASTEAAARIKAVRTIINDFVEEEPDRYAAEISRRLAVHEVKPATRAQTHAQYEARKKELRAILAAAQDEDAVVATGGTESNLMCPITRKPMTDPVRSQVCGHVYSTEGITGLLKQGKGKAKCPNFGCKKDVAKGDLVEDEETAVKLENARLTQGGKASAAAGSHDIDADY